MVLAEASAPPDSFPSDVPPSSDLDPYASSSPTSKGGTYTTIPITPTQSITLNLGSLPHPVGPLGLPAPQPAILTSAVQDSCRFAAQVLNRPATQQEAEAFAYHSAKSFRIASFGAPVGTALAMYQCFRTRKVFRFPGYTPFKEGSRFTPERFFNFGGRRALIMWHSSRALAYALLGSTLGSVFFGSYAISVSLVGRATDPRLKDFSDALKKMQQQGKSVREARAGMAKSASETQEEMSTTQPETYEMEQQRRKAQLRARSGREREAMLKQMAGESPTGGAFDNEYASGEADTGMMSDAQLSVQQARQDQEYRAASTDAVQSVQQAPAEWSPSPRATSSPSSPTDPQNGGVWERLRREAAAGKSNAGTTTTGNRRPSNTVSEQKQGSTLGDSFAFSDSNDDRQTSRAEAQREFDARMDQERQGKDFETGRGGKKW
ncbi:hypothetical protein B0A48_16377 [Cryoendolithus antarcticus]|uniref:Uncharacterized protein n=1 Tax=Cryoendolithus antarcticus TaxID=1507870 RepID=A0A1V8SDZ8_9PEZI|nr:hypothetical protein B0A48_16377 [Cryoendolithus antarcticus]